MKQAVLILLLVLTMTLFGVVQPDIPSPLNTGKPDSNNGLLLNGSNVAYTEPFKVGNPDLSSGITLDLTFMPSLLEDPRMEIMLELFDSSESERLVIGQWNRTLIILNSDDYNNRKNKPKIYLPLPNAHNEDGYRISIHSDQSGTRVFLNHSFEAFNPELKLWQHDSAGEVQLVIGNGASGRHPWFGLIYSMALYRQSISGGLVPRLLYSFSEHKTAWVEDLSGNLVHLHVSDTPVILKTEVLQLPDAGVFNESWIWRDALVNLLGFVPFGFLVYLWFSKKRINGVWSKLTLATLTAFGFSLLIELTQVYLPARHSSFLDLMLNTTGGLLGAIFAQIFAKTKELIAENLGISVSE